MDKTTTWLIRGAAGVFILLGLNYLIIPSKNNVRFIQGEIELTGNSCPMDYAYIGGGNCREVICKDEFSHDRKLAGKGWSCKDRRGLDTFFNVSLRFTGPAVRATTDRRCPLVEPEYARRNSCQNGLSEQQIFDSTNPLIKGDTPRKKKLPMACKNGLWDENHPKCREGVIASPMDLE